MKIKFVCSLTLLTCFLLSCRKEPEAISRPRGPRVSHLYTAEVIEGFKALTVRGDFNDGYIKKLPEKTFIYLADTIYPYMNDELELIISDINQRTGNYLTLKRTRDSALAIIQVHLTDSATYVRLEPAAEIGFAYYTYDLKGLTTPMWTSDNVISHEGVFVDMTKTDNNPSMQRYILRHEITHALGLYGHVHASELYTSIMYDFMITPYTTSYSSFDDSTIQLLYDPAVKAGMNEAALNRVLY